MPKKKITALDVLKRMRWLFTNKGWAQKTYARTSNGRDVAVTSDRAAKFCLRGAALRARVDIGASATARIKAEDLVGKCISTSIVTFNDTPGRKKSQILVVVNCAIKKARSSS